MANTSIKATIQSTQNPVVTKIIKNQTNVADVGGINVNYETVANGHVLAYHQQSNTFAPISVASARGAIAGGEVT